MPPGFVNRYIDRQYRRPSGLVGRYIGGLMVKQHAPENEWTVALLDAKSDDTILEIGFGGGYAIQRLSGVVTHGRLAGVDLSPTMVSQARRRNAAAVAAGRVDLRLGEASQLPFTTASFDKAFSIHSVYFWAQPMAALREVRRVLKPGGWLLLTLLPKAGSAGAADSGTAEFHPYTGADVQALLSEAGFVADEIRDGAGEGHRSNYTVIGRAPV